MNKNEIIKNLQIATEEFINFCTAIDEEAFFRQPIEKWSIAQNVDHLVVSAKSTKLAYSLPKFIIRLYAGKPNRPSRTYEELVAKYKLKLQQGGKASGRFVPEKVPASKGINYWLDQFNLSMGNLIKVIDAKWNDEQLDQYIAPHPLLGKITQRELCYFTIYHIQHHQDIIMERLNDYSPPKLSTTD